MNPRLRTRFCVLVGVDYPIVQTGMGWVAGARLTSATANAGGLGILASATMDLGQLRAAIVDVKERAPGRPFGVNLRADAADIDTRIDVLIEHDIRVASFAQAPKQALIDRLHAHVQPRSQQHEQRQEAIKDRADIFFHATKEHRANFSKSESR